MIDKLEMFIALATERHFGRAAEAIGVTQPTLSSAIRQLEEQLGVLLVQRGSRFQGLTPEGERLLDWARRIVADTRTMKAELRASRAGPTGQLRLGVIPTALPMAAELTAPLIRRHAGLSATILSRSADEITAQIDDLQIDAGITYTDGLPHRFASVELYRERLCLLAQADHPLVRQGRASWAEVAGQPLCLLTSDMRNRAIVTDRLAGAGFAVQPRIETNSIITIIAHVRTGQWLSVIPCLLAEMVAGDPALATLDLPGEDSPVGLVFLAREPRPPLIETIARIGQDRAGPTARRTLPQGLSARLSGDMPQALNRKCRTSPS